MLQTYQAELLGSQLIWLGEPPQVHSRERVVVVLERPAHVNPAVPVPDHAQAFMNARGCLGQLGRDKVLQQLEAIRQDWQRNPIEGLSAAQGAQGAQGAEGTQLGQP